MLCHHFKGAFRIPFLYLFCYQQIKLETWNFSQKYFSPVYLHIQQALAKQHQQKTASFKYIIFKLTLNTFEVLERGK